MKGVRLHIKGNWGQFRRPETNNNPLSHDFITKTALIGMIGAVLGKDRIKMKPLFPILSKDLKYGIQINNEVKKQSWGFTFRSVSNAWEKSPKQMEIIRNPDYTVMLCLLDNAIETSKEIFTEFVRNCKGGKSCYEPVLGLHNCPAEIEFIEEGSFEYVTEGTFSTKGFVSNKHKLEDLGIDGIRIGFDKVPTYQNDDFWNLPDEYVSVIYTSGNREITVSGEHFVFNHDSKWCLI
jgi:CRISPR-associated protein Cas5 subtype I-B